MFSWPRAGFELLKRRFEAQDHTSQFGLPPQQLNTESQESKNSNNLLPRSQLERKHTRSCTTQPRGSTSWEGSTYQHNPTAPTLSIRLCFVHFFFLQMQIEPAYLSPNNSNSAIIIGFLQLLVEFPQLKFLILHLRHRSLCYHR